MDMTRGEKGGEEESWPGPSCPDSAMCVISAEPSAGIVCFSVVDMPGSSEDGPALRDQTRAPMV